MACSLLVKNIANSWSTGDVIGVFNDDHKFGKLESKTKFIASGNNTNDWPRQFVIINISDANKSEFDHLLSDNENGRKYFCHGCQQHFRHLNSASGHYPVQQ